MKKDNRNNDLPESTPKEKPFSFNDLDLGLDFDLSFLDDIDESVLEEEPAAPKAAPVKEPAPVKKAPAKKPAAPAKDGTVKKAPVKKPAPEAKDGTVKKAAPAKKPAAKPVSAEGTERPVSSRPAAQKAPAKAAPAKKQPQEPAEPPKKKKKRGPRIGGVIFYTLYFLFILVFFAGTYVGLQFVQDWLYDFEAAQPTVKAEQVFTQLFTDPDWEALYTAAGAQDSPYEGKEEYVTYMENKVGSSKLNYLQVSAGLSGDQKYIVRLDDEKVASFTLTDRNQVGEASLENLENIADIPDWVLGSVEVFFEREESYLIQKVDGHTAYVNDVPLDDSFTIQIATTLAAEEYLPEGTVGASMCTQQITGLMELPTVKILDKNGAEMEVTYDEASRTFTERTESNTMSEDEKELALKAAKNYCLFMIEEAGRGDIGKYFKASSPAYKQITSLGELWMQGHAGYEFANEQVTEYARYTDTLYSVRVSLSLNVTRKDSTVKEYGYNMTLFFEKQDSGKWMVIEMTNKDVSTPIGKVRLTFMQDAKTQLHTNFFQTDAKEIVTPVLPIPEGKVFLGWVTIAKDADGRTIYNLVFEPDETGKVLLPEGNVLTPMTLYAYFEDADSVPTIETVPAETPAETVPETTAAPVPETTAAETAPAETTEGA